MWMAAEMESSALHKRCWCDYSSCYKTHVETAVIIGLSTKSSNNVIRVRNVSIHAEDEESDIINIIIINNRPNNKLCASSTLQFIISRMTLLDAGKQLFISSGCQWLSNGEMRSPSTALPANKRRCSLTCLLFNISPSGIEYRGAKNNNNTFIRHWNIFIMSQGRHKTYTTRPNEPITTLQHTEYISEYGVTSRRKL